MTGHQIASAYSSKELSGWRGANNPELVKANFDLLSTHFRPLGLPSVSGRKMMLYECCRKVLGKDTENYAQSRGDCTSFGMKNAVEYLTCTEILGAALRAGVSTSKDLEDFKQAHHIKFRPVFPPYFYGTGRVLIDHQEGDYNDGSLGSTMVAAVKKYGVLFSDEPGVPPYGKEVAGEWGAHQRAFSKWVSFGQNYLVKSAALINSWEEAVSAICNGYPLTTASSIGYSMQPGPDGFHIQNDEWNHQMQACGIDETYKNGSEPYVIILNSWGDCLGHLKDFETGTDLPIGVLRVRRRDFEKHITAGETFAISQFDGFPEQQLDKGLFLLG